MLDRAPAAVLASIFAQSVFKPVSLGDFPSVWHPIPIRVDTAESLEIALIFAAPVLSGVGQRDEFLALKYKRVAVIVFRKALVRLTLDARKLDRPADAAKSIPRVRVVVDFDFRCQSSPSRRQHDTYPVRRAAGI